MTSCGEYYKCVGSSDENFCCNYDFPACCPKGTSCCGNNGMNICCKSGYFCNDSY